MARSFVSASMPKATLTELPRSSRAEIMELARCAGLQLSEDLMEELCEAYPPFEDMVRRLPRGGALFDEPALVFAPRSATRSREDDG